MFTACDALGVVHVDRYDASMMGLSTAEALHFMAQYRNRIAWYLDQNKLVIISRLHREGRWAKDHEIIEPFVGHRRFVLVDGMKIGSRWVQDQSRDIATILNTERCARKAGLSIEMIGGSESMCFGNTVEMVRARVCKDIELRVNRNLVFSFGSKMQ